MNRRKRALRLHFRLVFPKARIRAAAAGCAIGIEELKGAPVGL
jgi:hypothetical protein